MYTGRDLADVPGLTLVPRGSTAMLDAIGRAVTATSARLAAMPEDGRPGTVIVGIMTDGLENASREFTYPMVKALIGQQDRVYGSTFMTWGQPGRHRGRRQPRRGPGPIVDLRRPEGRRGHGRLQRLGRHHSRGRGRGGSGRTGPPPGGVQRRAAEEGRRLSPTPGQEPVSVAMRKSPLVAR